jgi:hypothetical protein
MTLALALFAMAAQSNTKEMGDIRLVPVSPTPESETVMLKISVPKPSEVLNGNPVWIQTRLDGYPLGSISQFDRAGELAGSSMGQSIHVVIDNLPYFAVNGPALDPFDSDGYWYTLMYKFEVPNRLSEGAHTVRVFPARSYGESLKGENTFAATTFYVGSKGGGQAADLGAPYLTYNEPSEAIQVKESKPALLDFYVTNAELSPDGYKVKVTLDGAISRLITVWRPYYIYGLKSGKHTIRLQLLDADGHQVAGPFNDTMRTFTVK